MAWHPSGVCFWLKCEWFSCSVRTSLRISHYNPDVVVSSYHDADTHPWADFGKSLTKSLISTGSSLISNPIDSAGTRTRDDGRDKAKIYQDADAIGSPTALRSMLHTTSDDSSISTICPTPITPFRPYFHSFIDGLTWRGMLPMEALYPASWIPGMHEIGNWPLNSWANLYPRDGNVTQQHPVKAAAVLSQRVGDITTRSGQPHVYTQLPTNERKIIDDYMVWLPPSLEEMKEKTGKWQMLSPVADKSCEIFGKNDSVLPASWGDAKTDIGEAYAFNLWRPYSCCSKAGQFFLYAIVID